MARSLVCIQLDLHVPEAAVELAQDALREHGSAATQELWQGNVSPVVRGCFPDVQHAAAARDAVLKLDPNVQWSMDQAFWYDVEAYYALFHPLETQRFWVGPRWRVDEAPKKKKKHRIVVGGDDLVFGDLGHPTTAAALTALEALELEGRTVLDAGCGTGVLSVAAAKLKAKRVLGVDLESLEPARSLARAQRVKVMLEQRNVGGLDGSFDVVVCNMHLDHLGPLVPKLFTLFRRALVLSGYPERYREKVLGGRMPARVHNVAGFEAATFFTST
jgi:ribosomal protein L11 methylase PrmA